MNKKENENRNHASEGEEGFWRQIQEKRKGKTMKIFDEIVHLNLLVVLR